MTRVWRTVALAAAKLGIPKSLARALARDSSPKPYDVAPIPALRRHAQLSRARDVEVDETACGAAVSAAPATRHHEHGKVVAVDEADVVEVEAAGTIEGEFGKGSRRDGASARALNLARAAVAGEAGELTSGGIDGAECSGPDPTRPRFGED